MHALTDLLHPASPGRAPFLHSLDAPYAAETIRCAKIKITARCNLRCSFCQYWQMREPDELSTDEYRRVLDQLREAGCVKVHFSGGEATLRKDVFDLLAHAASLGMKANITTNGTTMNEERAARMVEAGTHSVSLSLDGPDPASHDALRGVPGAFEKTVRAIRWLGRAREKRRARMKLRLNTVLTRHNYRRLPELVDLAAELNMTEIIPMPVDERGAEPLNRLSKRDIREFNALVAPLALEARQRAGFSTEAHLVYPFGISEEDIGFTSRGRYARGYFKQHLCYVPWLHIFIAWNGDVFLCCMARGKTEPLGNVRQQSVQDVFNGEAYRAIRRQFQTAMPAVCHRCDMFVAENGQIERLLAQQSLA